MSNPFIKSQAQSKKYDTYNLTEFRLFDAAAKTTDKTLQECLRKGVAFHNASMGMNCHACLPCFLSSWRQEIGRGPLSFI